MKNYIVYNGQGEILKVGKCLDFDLQLQAADGEFVIEGIAKDDEQYMKDGIVTDKTTLTPVFNGSTISGLPIPCKVYIDDDCYIVEDGSAELSATLHGKYRLRIESAPHFVFSGEITL